MAKITIESIIRVLQVIVEVLASLVSASVKDDKEED